MAVSLGADVLQALPELRAQAGTLMRETATVTRSSGDYALDLDTGIATTTDTVIYEGPCRVRVPTTADRTNLRVVGDEQLSASRVIIEVPHDTFGIRVDDVVTIPDAEDTDVAGRRYRVTAVPAGTDTVLKTLGCEIVE